MYLCVRLYVCACVRRALRLCAGGGIDAGDTTWLNILHCVFLRNYGAGYGGAIRTTNNAHSMMQHSVFASNVAAIGGTLLLAERSRQIVVDCVVEKSKAVNGAIAALDTSVLRVSRCAVQHNLVASGKDACGCW